MSPFAVPAKCVYFRNDIVRSRLPEILRLNNAVDIHLSAGGDCVFEGLVVALVYVDARRGDSKGRCDLPLRPAEGRKLPHPYAHRLIELCRPARLVVSQSGFLHSQYPYQ